MFKCDLSIFPNEQLEIDINKANLQHHSGLDVLSNQNGKLNLFANNCPDVVKCDESAIEKNQFCQEYCSNQLSELIESGNLQTHCIRNEKNSTKKEETPESTKTLNSDGFLFYYRQFVNSFLEEINHEEILGEKSHFNINIMLSMHKIQKLRQFADSLDNKEASGSIQEATDILKSMFEHVEYFKPDAFADSISKTVIKIALDPRIQIALFLVITVVIMFSVLFNQIIKYKFSVKTLVVSLFLLMFIISVVNNHFLIIQKNQIFKNQKLNEKIPDECFGSSMTGKIKENEKNANIFSSTMTHLKSYFKLKPTSQVCLEFQEALLIDGKQANLIETILYTITESVRPISVLLGESINLFYSALTKNLSFYQYIPLMGVVTLIMVPVLVYMMSLLSLALFGYEFNFFHLISFKKSNNNMQPNEQSELLKVLSVLKKENEIIASEMIRSREDQNKLVNCVTNGIKSMCISTSSDIEPLAKIETIKSIEDSTYIDKKPDSYYNEPILEKEKPADNPNTSLNESICEEVVKYVSNSNKLLAKSEEKSDVLAYENKKLKEMIFYQKTNESINEEEYNNVDFSFNKENMSPICLNQAIIGLSKNVKKNGSGIRSLKNSYIKELSDNDFGDDDEDIVVILDEK